ncbi:MAG: hypothetical protein RLZZ66_1736 [Pseudomonadota bacterium]|jgi:hypothetical protein
MNKLIAPIFGRILSTIHLFVILSMIAIIFNFHERKISLLPCLENLSTMTLSCVRGLFITVNVYINNPWI